jgi:DNA modification methylase
MTLIEAIRTFFRKKDGPVHLQDLYSELPDQLEHSIRARIYERLGKEFRRVGKGLYVAYNASCDVTCVVACDDAWNALRNVPSGSVDALITDPPYPWLDEHVGHGTTRPRMQWDFDRAEIDLELGREIYRVLREGAHAFFFVPALTGSTERHLALLLEVLKKSGLSFNKLWIWDKVHMGLGYSGRARHEGILFCSKGTKRQPQNLTIPDVISCPRIPASRRRHPTEKPIGLLDKLIRFATKPKELVLDCFAGSCSTGRAALAAGRNALCIEKSASILEGAFA